MYIYRAPRNERGCVAPLKVLRPVSIRIKKTPDLGNVDIKKYDVLRLNNLICALVPEFRLRHCIHVSNEQFPLASKFYKFSPTIVSQKYRMTHYCRWRKTIACTESLRGQVSVTRSLDLIARRGVIQCSHPKLELYIHAIARYIRILVDTIKKKQTFSLHLISPRVHVSRYGGTTLGTGHRRPTYSCKTRVLGAWSKNKLKTPTARSERPDKTISNY